MRLGFAVKVLGAGGLPSHDTRRWQSEPSLGVSLDHLEAVLGYCDDHDLRMYRMATALAPYASHPDLPQFRDAPRRFADRLAEVGARARELGIRLSTHPGQYTVLNSEDERIRGLAVEELEVQAELLDGMGQPPEAIVVLHVGGAAGGEQAAMDRFCRGFELLSEAARARLVVENDDRTFSLRQVLGLSERIGRPVVWDILHHHCNDPDRIPDREALELALATWPAGVVPKIHYSTPKTAVEEVRKKVGRRVERRLVLPQLRAHADTIDPIGFEHFVTETAAGLDFDVMLEAKAKDLAVLALRDALAARGVALPTGSPRRAAASAAAA
ncbi:MAG: UV DNA damage repair endonuclease UvsE [Solirubrobacterales bacterium]|nr:UV DNA damage repair endonuclease UvsE [Solirubrobacterales bacterium]